MAQLHAVRTFPKTCKVKDGTMCTYDVVYTNTKLGSMRGKFGCGVDLAIQLLKYYKKNKKRIDEVAKQDRLIKIYKMMEEKDDKRKRIKKDMGQQEN